MLSRKPCGLVFDIESAAAWAALAAWAVLAARPTGAAVNVSKSCQELLPLQLHVRGHRALHCKNRPCMMYRTIVRVVSCLKVPLLLKICIKQI